jgi:hypothetical protein
MAKYANDTDIWGVFHLSAPNVGDDHARKFIVSCFMVDIVPPLSMFIP